MSDILTSNWQPIETAPKDGTEVLCFQPDNKKACVVRAKTKTIRIDQFVKSGRYHGCPGWWRELPETPYTMWTPLPEQPKET